MVKLNCNRLQYSISFNYSGRGKRPPGKYSIILSWQRMCTTWNETAGLLYCCSFESTIQSFTHLLSFFYIICDHFDYGRLHTVLFTVLHQHARKSFRGIWGIDTRLHCIGIFPQQDWFHNFAIVLEGICNPAQLALNFCPSQTSNGGLPRF